MRASAPDRKRSAQLSNEELRGRAHLAASRLLAVDFSGVLEKPQAEFLADLLHTLAKRVPPNGRRR